MQVQVLLVLMRLLRRNHLRLIGLVRKLTLRSLGFFLVHRRVWPL